MSCPLALPSSCSSLLFPPFLLPPLPFSILHRLVSMQSSIHYHCYSISIMLSLLSFYTPLAPPHPPTSPSLAHCTRRPLRLLCSDGRPPRRQDGARLPAPARLRRASFVRVGGAVLQRCSEACRVCTDAQCPPSHHDDRSCTSQ